MKRVRGEISYRETSEISNSTSSLEVTKQTRWIFSLLGMWSMIKKNTTNFEKRLSIPIFLFNQIFLAFIIIPAIIQLLYREKNIKVQFSYCGPLTYLITGVIKCLSIIYCRHKIRKCIKQIENDWNEIVDNADREIMIKNMNVCKKITTFFGAFMYSGGILHQIIMPFLSGSIVSIFDNTTNRLLVYPVYDVMIDHKISPAYEILYITHIIVGIISCTITIGTCNLSILFITHIASLNEIMAKKLVNLIDNRDGIEENINHKIMKLINCHLKLIKFSSNVEKSLRQVCMVATFETLYISCLTEYYTMMAWKHDETFSAIIYFFLIQAFIGNFFIFCHAGEISKEHFRKTGETVYMTKWYRLSDKNARYIILIIAATQRSPKITAGGLMELSYSGFVSIVRTTIAYANVLRMIDT